MDEFAIAQLRHLYANLVGGGVKDSADAKRIADGLLAPVIERLESLSNMSHSSIAEQKGVDFCAGMVAASIKSKQGGEA